MSATLQDAIFTYMLVLCRIGTAFAAMPGMAGSRIPMTVRAVFVMAISAALWPLIAQRPIIHQAPILAVASEVAVGFVIGFWAYCFSHAIRFASAYVMSAIGLGGIPGQPLADHEPDSALGSILTLGFAALIFASDLHLSAMRAMLSSYVLIPQGGAPDFHWAMAKTLDVLGRTSMISLQMAAPFMMLSISVNFALGLANRMTPNLSVYFAFTGLLTLGAMAVLALASPTSLALAADAYRDFIENSW